MWSKPRKPANRSSLAFAGWTLKEEESQPTKGSGGTDRLSSGCQPVQWLTS